MMFAKEYFFDPMHTGLFTELIRLGFQQRTLLKNSVTRFLTFLLFINRNIAVLLSLIQYKDTTFMD